MSKAKLTYRARSGKDTEEVLEKFKSRRSANIQKLSQRHDLEWVEHDRRTLPVTVGPISEPNCTPQEIRQRHFFKDENKKEHGIDGTFCAYCKEYIKGENPWKRGVYVFPICRTCLQSVGIIEDFLSNKGAKTMRTRKTMNEPQSVSVDWDSFEKLIQNRQAKLSLLSKKYKLYPEEMKTKIVEKYGSKVVFKKGRYGGIFWTPAEDNNQ